MLQEPVYLPQDYKQWVTLLDGRRALIRPIYHTDKDALCAFFDRLSLETRFLRFHCAKAAMTEEELEFYCKVDYNGSFVLVAEITQGRCTDIVGVGRYDRLSCLDRAEVAFVVEDKEQGKGIGTQLLKKMALIARERGITTFVAELVRYNVVMLDIFRKYDPALRQVLDGNSYLVTFSV